MKSNFVELLAPAGSQEAFLAAINNGADAVYLGGKLFNARQSAANFSNEELEKAVKYAHLHKAKVYVAVNTLVADKEFEELIHYLNFLYSIGIDAIIVQDLGVIKVVQDLFPELEVHASTQMTAHNAEGVAYLTDMGITRVVLAREVSLKNMKEIYEKTGAELEVFVHGALCVAYSGQCLMSSMIGGRSGNRGKCAQPCRLKYELIGKEQKSLAQVGEHLLSPRDLNTLEFLPEIARAGIKSLKIEGRMKRPEYVATIVNVYRKALDTYYNDPTKYTIGLEDIRDVKQIFNRDFTSGYFHTNQGADLMSYKRPNNRGIYLGRVASANLEEKSIICKIEEDLAINDGLECWVTRGGRVGATVKKLFWNNQYVEKVPQGAEVKIFIDEQVRKGDRIFKTLDINLVEKARLTYGETKRFPVDIQVDAKEGFPFKLAMQDEEGNQVEVISDFIVEKAIKRPMTKEAIIKQLDRLGNTNFYLRNIEINLEGDVIVPVSEINNIRRRAIEELLQKSNIKLLPAKIELKVINDYLKGRSAQQGSRSSKIKLTVNVDAIETASIALEAGADKIYVQTDPFREHRSLQLKELNELSKIFQKKRAELILALPRIWHEDEEAKHKELLNKLLEMGFENFLISNLGSLNILNKMSPKVNKYLDYSLNVFNSFALDYLAENKVKSICLSPELNFGQLAQIKGNLDCETECIVQGNLPLMISEYCALGSAIGERRANTSCKMPCKGDSYFLRDRLKFKFPVKVDRNCRMHIYNAKELCLIEDIDTFKDMGINNLRIEGRIEHKNSLKKIVAIYKNALNNHKNQESQLKKEKAELEKLSPNGLTKGHYYRGVL